MAEFSLLLRSVRCFGLCSRARVRNLRLVATSCANSTNSSSFDQVPDSFSSPDGGYSSDAAVDSSQHGTSKVKRIGKAVQYYMNQMRMENEKMNKETAEFELGRRHLANMMGVSVDEMGQHEIDRAIEYLLPSGLFERNARPMMKHPTLLYPTPKGTQFDESGRPLHTLYYTLSPNFYNALSEISEKTHLLKSKEIGQHFVHEALADEKQILNLAGSTWLSREEMLTKWGESINEEMHNQMIVALEYLISLADAYKFKDFIMNFRKEVVSAGKLSSAVMPKIKVDETTGRRYSQAKARRKSCFADVTVYENGSGLFMINGLDIEDFRFLRTREIMLAPFIVLGALGEWDVEATAKMADSDHQVIGRNATAGAVRLGLARALSPFLPTNQVTQLSLAGLLTRDVRLRERNKINQPGARKKATWKRR